MPKPKTIYLVQSKLQPGNYRVTRTVNTTRLEVGETITKQELESLITSRGYDVIIDAPKQ